MVKYIAFWIDKFIPLDDCNPRGSCLFENFIVNLSSEYNVVLKYPYSFIINKSQSKKDGYNPSSFFSKNISDLKVLIGDNGAGKTQLLKKIAKIAAGYKDHKEKYVLISVDEEGRFECITNVSQDIHYFVGDGSTPYPLDRKEENDGETCDDLCIYYSPIFNDVDYREQEKSYTTKKKMKDISTDALLTYDFNEWIVHNAELAEKNKDSDRLSVYFQMEHRRMNDFLIENGEHFSTYFNVPNQLVLSPMLRNVWDCLDILICKNEMQIVSHYAFEEPDFEEDGLSMKKKEEWLEQARECAKKKFESLSLDDQFRYSMLISFYCRKDFDNDEWEQLLYFDDIQNMALWKSSLFDEQREKMEVILYKCRSVGALQEKHYLFNINPESRGVLKEINRLYDELMFDFPFLVFSLPRPFSSGERYLLKFYYRLYSVIKRERSENICLFIDEADTCFHPNWQYHWMERFISGIKTISDSLKDNEIIQNDLSCQVFMTTHSPFILSELLQDNVVFLKREYNKDAQNWQGVSIQDYLVNEMPATFFAGNLFDLLNSGFLVKNTIGSFAEKKLKECIELIKNSEKKDYVNMLISQIGDPILKELVSNLRD